MVSAPPASWIADYLQHVRVEKQLAARTLALYTEHLRDLQHRCTVAGVGLHEVQESHVRQWMAQLRSHGRQPKGIALVLSCWRSFYTWLGQQGRVQRHPVLNVRPPKAGQRLPKALSVEEALHLATSAHNATLQDTAPQQAFVALQRQCVVELLYGSGLRISELLQLDAQPSPHATAWLDLDAGEAHVLGKGSKRRMVPLSRPAVQAVQAWLPARQAWLAHHPQADPAALLLGLRGQRLTPQVARQHVAAVARQAGLAGHVHPHMLRHSFASHVLQSSGDLRAVQELVGHSSIATTQIYTRLDFQHLAKAYDAAHPRAKKKPPP